MIQMLHRILKFCGGRFAAKIRIAYLFTFLKAICPNAPIFVAVWLMRLLMDGTADVLSGGAHAAFVSFPRRDLSKPVRPLSVRHRLRGLL